MFLRELVWLEAVFLEAFVLTLKTSRHAAARITAVKARIFFIVKILRLMCKYVDCQFEWK